MTNPREFDSIFLAALEIEREKERAEFIDKACGQDPECRAEVERLLAAHDKAGSFMREEDGPLATVDQPQRGDFEEGTEIGNYKLLQRIGEGGFGAVYMAEQQRPVRRKVALKIVKPGMDSKDVIARFEAERQALALMDHPNIAKVLDAGDTGDDKKGTGPICRDGPQGAAHKLDPSPFYRGRPYFVMELVKGVPVTEYCDKNRLGTRERLELFVTLCHAVQHAHQKGVIHRDIKPSNVMVTLHDGKPVPKVIDFGVSKALNQQLTEKTLFTRYGQMIGTPQYMSPEQAEMSGLDIDTRSDIFSLGVVLYELLTGQTPLDSDRLRSAGFAEMQRMIQNEEPARPSVRLSTLGEKLTIVAEHRSVDPGKLRQTIQGELDWIVMKALEKDRGRRYASASSFADDVQRYLADEPIEACPPSTAYRLRKFARRNKGPVAAAAVVFSVLLVAFVVVSVLLFQVNLAENHARTASDEAIEARDEAKKEAQRSWELKEESDENRRRLADTLYAQRIARAYEHVRANQPIDALKQLELCPEELRKFEWHLVKRLCHGRGRRTVDVPGRIHTISVRAADKSTDTVIDEKVVVGLDNGTAMLFDQSLPRDHEEFSFYEDATEFWRKHWVQISPRQDILAASAMSNNVQIRHLPTGQVKLVLPAEALVTSVAFSPSGEYLAAVGNEPNVRVWNVASGAPAHVGELRDFRAWAVCFSPDERFLAAAGTDGELKVWDVETWQLRFPPERAHWAPVESMCFSPDSRELATASYDLFIRIRNSESGTLVNKWIAGKAELSCVVYNPTGTRLVSASYDGTITIWNAHTYERLLVLRDHDEVPLTLAFSGDGRTLYSGGDGMKVHVWDGSPWNGSLERLPKVLEEFQSRVLALAIKPDGSELAAGGEDGIVKIYSLPSGEKLAEFPKHGEFGTVFDLAYEPDGPHIMSTGTGDGGAIVAARWNTKTGVDAFPPVGRGAVAVAIHPSGDRFVVAGFDGELNVYESLSGNPVGDGPLGRHDRQVGTMAFGPNGRFLVSASTEREVKLWDAQRLDERQTVETLLNLQGPWGPPMGFDPAGRMLAIGDGNDVLLYDIELYDTENRSEFKRLPGHGDTVNGTAYSHNGEFLASGSTDGTVKLWNAKTGDLLDTLLVEGAVYRVAFTPDDDWLATAGEDTNVKLWNLSFLSDALAGEDETN